MVSVSKKVPLNTTGTVNERPEREALAVRTKIQVITNKGKRECFIATDTSPAPQPNVFPTTFLV